MTRRRLRLAAAALLTALLLVAAALAWLRHFALTPQGPSKAAPALVTVEAGARAATIAADLARANVVRPAWLFLVLARWTGRDRDLQPGEYCFHRPVAPIDALDLLSRDSPWVRTVTVPEGLGLAETAAVIARAGVASETALLAAFRDPGPIRTLDPEAQDLEGYLLGGTRRFSPGVDPERVAQAFVRDFARRFVAKHAAQVARSGRSLREIVTLASLVEKETAQPMERGLIAGVFLARLERGMRLQSDPTVIYVSRALGVYRGVIGREDLEREHPYNTYTRIGLPPGPIASPGLAALEAALAPERSDALYFVARRDGTHAFSRTLAEHERAVQQHRR